MHAHRERPCPCVLNVGGKCLEHPLHPAANIAKMTAAAQPVKVTPKRKPGVCVRIGTKHQRPPTSIISAMTVMLSGLADINF